MIQVKSAREIEKMRQAGRHVGEILIRLRPLAQPGVTTQEFNRLAAEEIERRGLRSSFLGYTPGGGSPPFPAVICTSINEEVVHGIPGPRELKSGDLLKLDFGVIFESFHGDAAVTLPIGEPSPEARRLMQVTRDSLYAGIEQMQDGRRLGDLSHAVQQTVESAGFSIVRQFVGHGIGRSLHEPPQVPNFGEAARGPRLRPGIVLAIEPMVNAGGYEAEVLEDRWTAVTVDRSLSCHFEHTVVVGENGPEILTWVEDSH
jgi:methionyl aminopeptidase